METTKLFKKMSLLLFAVVTITSCDRADNPVYDNTPQRPEQRESPGMGAPATEQAENSTVTYQYSEEVLPLSQEAKKQYLVKVESDSILYFRADTPDSIMPRVGEIISSRVSDETPYGLGNKVISKEDVSGLVKFVTSAAPLDEIFEDLQIESEFSIDKLMTDTDGFCDDEGNYYDIKVRNINDVFPELAKARTRSKINPELEKVIEIPFKLERDSGAFAEFSLVLGATLTFDTDFVNGTYEYSIKPIIGINGTFGVKLSMADSTKFTNQVQTLVQLVSKKKLIETFCQVGPVTIRPFIDFSIEMIGKIAGSISIGAKYYAGVKCGWRQTGWFCENVSDAFNMDDIIKSLEIKGRIEVGPQLTFTMGLGLYTKNLALMINTKPSLKFGAEVAIEKNIVSGELTSEEPKLTLDFDVEAEGELYADILLTKLQYKTPAAKIRLFHHEWPLFPSVSFFEILQVGNSPKYDVEYQAKAGVLCALMKMTPGIRVRKEGKIILDTYENQNGHGWGWSYRDGVKEYEYDAKFGVNLSQYDDEVYKMVPIIKFGDTVWEFESLASGFAMMSCPDNNHPHMIDLGLSKKWSCCNLGAKSPSDDYWLFGWGDVTADNSYISVEKFIGYDIARTNYDAAYVHSGHQWQMPSDADITELLENSDIDYTGKMSYYMNDTEGSFRTAEGGILTSKKNKKRIFITNSWSSSCYWQKDDDGNPTYLTGVGSLSYNYSKYVLGKTSYFGFGLPIRPVQVK